MVGRDAKNLRPLPFLEKSNDIRPNFNARHSSAKQSFALITWFYVHNYVVNVKPSCLRKKRRVCDIHRAKWNIWVALNEINRDLASSCERKRSWLRSLCTPKFVNVLLEWHAQEGESPVTNRKGILWYLPNVVWRGIVGSLCFAAEKLQKYLLQKSRTSE